MPFATLARTTLFDHPSWAVAPRQQASTCLELFMDPKLRLLQLVPKVQPAPVQAGPVRSVTCTQPFAAGHPCAGALVASTAQLQSRRNAFPLHGDLIR